MIVESVSLAIFPFSLTEPGNFLMSVFVLYIGPETIFPLTSFFAAIVGFLLMFWRWVVGVFRKSMRFCFRTFAHLAGKNIEAKNVETSSDVDSKEQQQESP